MADGKKIIQINIEDEMKSRGLLNEFEFSEIPQTVEFFRSKIF